MGQQRLEQGCRGRQPPATVAPRGGKCPKKRLFLCFLHKKTDLSALILLGQQAAKRARPKGETAGCKPDGGAKHAAACGGRKPRPSSQRHAWAAALFAAQLGPPPLSRECNGENPQNNTQHPNEAGAREVPERATQTTETKGKWGGIPLFGEQQAHPRETTEGKPRGTNPASPCPLQILAPLLHSKSPTPQPTLTQNGQPPLAAASNCRHQK